MNRGSVSALSAGAYTATSNMMVNIVKESGHAPLPSHDGCMPESGRCHSVCTLWETLSNVLRESLYTRYAPPSPLSHTVP
jgi:hypothetical protein